MQVVSLISQYMGCPTEMYFSASKTNP